MDKILKIISIVLVVVLIVLGVFFWQRSASQQNPNSIQITQIKDFYYEGENVIVAGRTQENCQILYFWDEKFGIGKSDKSGNWSVNFGKMPEGAYNFQVLADNSNGNISIASAQIKVVAATEELSFAQSVIKNFVAALSFGNWNQQEVILVPASTPEALQGKWNLLK